MSLNEASMGDYERVTASWEKELICLGKVLPSGILQIIKHGKRRVVMLSFIHFGIISVILYEFTQDQGVLALTRLPLPTCLLSNGRECHHYSVDRSTYFCSIFLTLNQWGTSSNVCQKL